MWPVLTPSFPYLSLITQSPLIWSLSTSSASSHAKFSLECHAWASQLVSQSSKHFHKLMAHMQDIEVSEAQAGPLTVVFSDVKNTRKHCSTPAMRIPFQSHKCISSSSPSGLFICDISTAWNTMHQLFT